MFEVPIHLYRGGQVAHPPGSYDYLLAAQGLIKRIDNAIVRADHFLLPAEVELYGLNLKSYSLSPIQLKVPRIPTRYLHQILQESQERAGVEHMYYAKYDSHSRTWTVLRPEQEQDPTRVRYQASSDPHICLEIHSHNTMPAFFSDTDDRDEMGGRFYAVMGRVDRPQPELVLRLGLYGLWISDVPAEILFEDIAPFKQVTARQYDPHQFENYFYQDEQPGQQTWVNRFFNW